ncbi:hypothetical protein TNCV_4598131 [Trichonephila clavipes]|nr:hypothetical protein TNCV_4598131 [Trichonephila clavipes]
MDELLEMSEQEQGIEKLESLDPVQSRASPPYTAGLSWYWARTHDMPAMIRYIDHWATVVLRNPLGELSPPNFLPSSVPESRQNQKKVLGDALGHDTRMIYLGQRHIKFVVTESSHVDMWYESSDVVFLTTVVQNYEVRRL